MHLIAEAIGQRIATIQHPFNHSLGDVHSGWQQLSLLLTKVMVKADSRRYAVPIEKGNRLVETPDNHPFSGGWLSQVVNKQLPIQFSAYLAANMASIAVSPASASRGS